MSVYNDNDESDYLDERSTDGSDNGSDLEDFIAEENSDEEEEVTLDEPKGIDDEVAELKQDNVELVESATIVNGVRRSTRKRKATTTYEEEILMQDKEFQKLQKMMHKGIEDLGDSTDDDDEFKEDDDDDFQQSSKSDSGSDSSDSEEEEDDEEAPVLPKKVRFADNNTTVTVETNATK